jgi:FkbM family methyltransferase
MFSLKSLEKYLPNLNSNSKNFKICNKKIFDLVKNSDLFNPHRGLFFFKEIGRIYFPFFNMGKISSSDLFSLNEFLIFYFYLKYKKKYKKAADMGANLGLHTIVLSKLGIKVDSYEPDPNIYNQLKKNIKNNKCRFVKLIKAAVYNKNKFLKFTRVHDNLTGSHISSEKKSYGNKSSITVKTVNINDIANKYDLIKMDIESAEATVLTSLNESLFFNTDIIVEVGNKSNANKIYKFLKKNNLKSFSQKKNFLRVKYSSDMPSSHRDGLLLISQTMGDKIF